MLQWNRRLNAAVAALALLALAAANGFADLGTSTNWGW
jgi:hypothetical protein